MMTDKVLTVTLRQFLDAHGLTAYQLAKDAGMAEQTVYSIVRGHRQPSADSLNGILNALSRLVGRTVEVGEIYAFSPDPAPQAGAEAQGGEG